MSIAVLLVVIALILAILAAAGVGGRLPLLAIAVILLCIAALFAGPLGRGIG